MNTRLFSTWGAIALLSLTACTNPSVETDTAPEADLPPETEVATPDPETPVSEIVEGVTLSEDGQTIVMAEFAMLDAYCMGGDGKLAISFVGEEPGSDDQLVSCGSTFDGFESDRESGFEGVTVVAPAIADNALQLNEGEYTRVQCLSDHAGLDPAPENASDGHMVLNCL
ncbi:hypothetical protein [Leptolyngbya iicbica]|uniref:Lipoprotein n=2 Tax=Cyanophyceae TaxID=3028117 RepID=A0A4Q7E1K9_9CYAN|nr:hypothetical protein [Leptolyngbya sp. LK]RZM75413.1 hypothetical protein DYY88_20990 [Leptolyngbya sp. LK]